jgi:hypothetical protein
MAADQLMDLSDADPATFAQLCGGYFQGSFSAQDILQGANQQPDRGLVQQAVADLDRWYPGWSVDELSRDVRIVVTNQIPYNEGGACRVSGSDHPGFILIGTGGWQDPVGMATGLMHEATHIQNSVMLPGLTSNEDEGIAWQRAAKVYQRAAEEETDPAKRQEYLARGNYNDFLGEQLGRCNIQYSPQMESSWIVYAWVDLKSYLKTSKGLTDGQYVMLGSFRVPDSKDPSTTAQYIFNLDLGDGKTNTVTLVVDEMAERVITCVVDLLCVPTP